MVGNTVLKNESLKLVADKVARALSFAETEGTSAFVTTAVSYADGTSAVVRIDNAGADFLVSDGGYGFLSAELMGASHSYTALAPKVAKRFGVEFDQHAFFVLKVTEAQLPGAVSVIANASAVAVERTIYAIEQRKIKVGQEVFEAKLHEAFGAKVLFDVLFRGVTQEWKFDAAIEGANGISSVLELVSPAYGSIASAHMKLGDVHQMTDAARSVAVLRDYEKTKPSYRNILSSSSSAVISVQDSSYMYQEVA